MPRQLGRDMARRWTGQRQINQHRASLRLIRLLVAALKNCLRAGLVQQRTKQEMSARARLHRTGAIATTERPAGEYLGKAGDIGLGVAGIHAERMQFQNLACQILVQPERALSSCRALRQRGIRSD